MLDPSELIALSPKAAALIDQISTAASPEGEGGKKITRAEAGRIIRAALALVQQLVIDLID